MNLVLTINLIGWIIVDFLLHVGGERHYLLNFIGNKPNQNLYADCPTTCKSVSEQESQTERGWEYNAGFGGWFWFQTADLDTDCCQLKTKPLTFQDTIFVPKTLKFSITVRFMVCTPYSTTWCKETLIIIHSPSGTTYTIKIDKDKVTDVLHFSFNFNVSSNTSSSSLQISSKRFFGFVRKMEYYFDYCPDSTHKLVKYPAMNTDETKYGRCIENAVKMRSSVLTRNCDFVGKSVYKGSCECDRGFTLTNETCLECDGNSIKPNVGNDRCVSCPVGSHTNQNKTQCICNDGYRRFNQSDERQPCKKLECDGNSIKPNVGSDRCVPCPVGSHTNENKSQCICNNGYRRFNQSDEPQPCYKLTPCQEENIDLGTLGSYFSPAINATKSVRIRCQYGSRDGNSSILRKCLMNETGYVEWDKLDLSTCKHAPCPEETLRNESLGNYHFPKTEVGGSVKYTCMYGNKNDKTEVLYRQCLVNNRTNNSGWTRLNLTSCKHLNELISDQRLDKINFTKDNVEEILSGFLTAFKNKSSKFEILQAVTFVFNSLEVAVTKEVFGLVLDVINDLSVISNKSGEASSKLLEGLDRLADAIIRSPMNVNTPVSFDGSNIGFSLWGIHKNKSRPIKSVVRKIDKKISVLFISSNVSHHTENLESFELPKEVLDGKRNTNYVYSYIFKNSSLFIPNDTHQHGSKMDEHPMVASSAVEGHVISMTIHNKTIKNLKNPIKYTMKVSKENTNGICAYWKTEGYYINRWSTSGCNATNTFTVNNQRYVTCECDHLTSFAVLFNVNEESFEIAASFELSLISQMGCYISISSLIISFVALTFLSELRRRTANRILINLCISLFFLMATFLVGIGYTQSTGICTNVAMLLHMFVLSTFTWMCVEALSLYRKAVRTFKNRGEGSRFFKGSFIIAWLGPFIVAIVTRYAGKGYSLPAKNQDHCMVTGKILQYALILPVSVLLAFNILLFVPIIRKVQGHITTRFSFSSKIPKPKRLRRRTRVTFSCTVLLGVTWVFAYLSIGEASYLFQWLFTIFNSLQGLFILIFHVILNDQVIGAWRAFFKMKSSKEATSSSLSLHVYRNDTNPFWRELRNGGSTKR